MAQNKYLVIVQVKEKNMLILIFDVVHINCKYMFELTLIMFAHLKKET